MSTAEAHLKKALGRLRVAEKLFFDGEYEDAVSRAYYAMYHAAKAALFTVNVFPRTHEGVVSEFGKRLVLVGFFSKELGKALANAKAARETYEYDVTSAVGEAEAKGILLDAKKLVNTVERYLEKG